MSRKSSCFATTILLVSFIASAAPASPIFSIGEGGSQSWSQAVANGNVVGVSPGGPVAPGSGLTWAAQQFYSSQGSFQQSAVILTPDVNVSDGNEIHQSLVMSWDPPTDPTFLGVAAWDYVYDVDPDLTNTVLSFSLFPPPGIWDFSLELIDAAGLSRGWFASGPPPLWATHAIRPDIAALQGPFTSFFSQPGFDIKTVVAIRLDEAGMFTPSFPVDPTLNGTAWNAWNHLRVSEVPEPTSLAIFAIGVVGLIGYRRLRGKHLVENPTEPLKSDSRS